MSGRLRNAKNERPPTSDMRDGPRVVGRAR